MQEYYKLTPESYGMEYEDVWLKSEDGTKLHAWMISLKEWDKESRASRPVIMFFQENAGTGGSRTACSRVLGLPAWCEIDARRCNRCLYVAGSVRSRTAAGHMR